MSDDTAQVNGVAISDVERTAAKQWGIDLNAWYYTNDICTLLEVSPEQVRRLFHSDELVGFRLGHSYRCRGHELARLIASSATNAEHIARTGVVQAEASTAPAQVEAPAPEATRVSDVDDLFPPDRGA